MNFRQVKTKNKSVHVAEQIIQVILDGDYRVGDKLPPERVIVENTGVSRPAVREALAALQIAGIIEGRPGDGTYVRRSKGEIRLVQSTVFSFLQESTDPFEVLDARRVIERSVVQAVIERNNVTEIQAIQQALDQMGHAAKTKNHDEYFEADHAFHLALVKATGNILLERVIASLVGVMREELWQNLKSKYYLSQGDKIQESFKNHCAILEAIRTGDKALAIANMETHFDEVVNHMGYDPVA